MLDENIWKNTLDLYYKQSIIKKLHEPVEIFMYILIGKFYTCNAESIPYIQLYFQ